MEKLRQAIRQLEAQAEKFERHLGAERFPAPDDKFFAGLTQDVEDVTAQLQIPEPKKVKPAETVKAAKPALDKPVVSAKGEESPV